MKTFRAEFVNVDLDIKSFSDLSVIVTAWDNRVIPNYLDNSSRQHWLRVMLTSDPKSPADAIRRFAKLVRGLPKRARTTWAQATSKEFDIGIQAGYEARAGEWVLEADDLQAVADMGGSVRFTVYSPFLLIRENAKRKRRR